MNPIKTITVLSALSAAAASPALANPPHLPDLVRNGNRWTITFHDDSSAVHQQWATQGLCFYYAGTVGTQQRYIWVSDTYPDWNGLAAQEGDQIFMHGDFQWPWGVRDGGHDGMQWEVTTLKDGGGHWQEWVENGRLGVTIGFGNAKLLRTGSCTQPGFEDAARAEATNAQLPIPRDSAGKELTNPMGVPDAATTTQP